MGDAGTVRYLSYSRDEGFVLQTPIRPTPSVSRRGIDLPDGRVGFSEVGPAKITAMAGELTWRPRLGETLQVAEAKRKGTHYSAELTADEVEVVGGESLTPRETWTMLGRADKIADLDAREARARARRRSALRLAFACAVAALGFAAAAVLVAGSSGTTIAEGTVVVDVEPFEAPSVATERALVRLDTIPVVGVRLPAGRAVVVELTATLPVGPPLALNADVAFVGTGGTPVLVTDGPSLSAPVGAEATVTSAPARVAHALLGGGDAFDAVLLVERWWSSPSGSQAWAEPATIPVSVEVREVWTPGPFWAALGAALLLGCALFVFAASGPR